MSIMHPLLRRLDLNLLLVFDSLHRHRSVAGAAHELALSASAFSHALARLRDTLGDELFVRQGNRMYPTQRAERLATAVAASLGSLSDELGRWAPFDPLTSERVFTFAATDFTALQLVPSLVARLQDTAPHLQLRMVQAGRKVCVEQLASGEVDFALGYGEERDSLPMGIDSLEWTTGRYVVIARRGHPRIRESLDLEGYLAERHVVVTPWGEATGVVDLVLRRMALRRNVALQIPSVLACPFIIAGSDLIMTIPQPAVERLAPAVDIVQYEVPFEIEPYILRLYSHRKYARSDAHTWMIGQLQELFDPPAIF